MITIRDRLCSSLSCLACRAYASVVAVLASAHEAVLEAALRSYELLLLREVGFFPPARTPNPPLGGGAD